MVSAEQIDRYRLRLRFSDAAVWDIDFEPFLRHSGNPLIRKFLDPQRFSARLVEDGNLVWGDYDLCFPIVDLYENRIWKRQTYVSG